MVNRKRKYESGAAVAFISRGKALKKLQLSLSDFRRLCILKGIYPQEPRHPKVANKGSTTPTTFYLLKDIQFLLHEPIVHKMRDHKIFVRRLKKAVHKRDETRAKGLRRNKPKVSLDHIVKERYPSLLDALKDLDDALSICFLFAKMPKNKKVPHQLTRMCKRLVVEFMNFVIASKSLRKVFISIKGFYLQVSIQGQDVTWLMPHNVAYTHPLDVDYRIMSTFSEFSCVLLGFVNFALYQSLEMTYPPTINVDEYDDVDEVCNEKDLITEVLAALTSELRSSDYDLHVDSFEKEEPVDLFKGLKFYISREVNREIFTFIIRCFGGEASWDRTVYPLGCSYDVDDDTITHQVVDKPNITDKKFSRTYLQPQWLADCVNARRLLPVKDYTVGAVLPAHLSPFVVEEEGDYVPPEKIRLNKLIKASRNEELQENDDDEDEEEDDDEEEEEEEEDASKIVSKRKRPMDKTEKVAKEGKVQKWNSSQRQQEEKNQERKLAEMAIPKKHKRLYNKIQHLSKMKKQEAQTLAAKRKMIDAKQKKQK